MRYIFTVSIRRVLKITLGEQQKSIGVQAINEVIMQFQKEGSSNSNIELNDSICSSSFGSVGWIILWYISLTLL